MSSFSYIFCVQAENERALQAPLNRARVMNHVDGEAAEGGDGNLLRGGAEELMNAMRELLHTMTFR